MAAGTASRELLGLETEEGVVEAQLGGFRGKKNWTSSASDKTSELKARWEGPQGEEREAKAAESKDDGSARQRERVSSASSAPPPSLTSLGRSEQKCDDGKEEGEGDGVELVPLHIVGFLAEGSCGCVALCHWEDAEVSPSMVASAYDNFPGLIPVEQAQELAQRHHSPHFRRRQNRCAGGSGDDADDHSAPFAVKVIELAAQGMCSRANVSQEIEMMRRVSGSPFVTEFKFAEELGDSMYIGMGLCSGGDLFSVLNYESLEASDVLFYAMEIALGLQHVHDNDIIHGDVKPENVAINGSGHVVIIDFGLATVLDPRGDRNPKTGKLQVLTHSGTLPYCAPEILKRMKHGCESDWWSFGVLLFEMLFGQLPWENDDEDELCSWICSGPVVPPAFDSADRQCLKLIEGLLEKQPSKRLGHDGGIAELMETRFFARIDWEAARALRYRPPFVVTGGNDLPL